MDIQGEYTPESIVEPDEVRIEALLREFREVDLQRWLAGLDLAQTVRLHPRRFYPIYLNLLSVFHHQLPVERIREIAVECCKGSIWNHRAIHYYLEQIPRWCPDEVERSMQVSFDESQIECID